MSESIIERLNRMENEIASLKVDEFKHSARRKRITQCTDSIQVELDKIKEIIGISD